MGVNTHNADCFVIPPCYSLARKWLFSLRNRESAGSGTRTRTGVASQGILSPLRLPFRHAGNWGGCAPLRRKAARTRNCNLRRQWLAYAILAVRRLRHAESRRITDPHSCGSRKNFGHAPSGSPWHTQFIHHLSNRRKLIILE